MCWMYRKRWFAQDWWSLQTIWKFVNNSKNSIASWPRQFGHYRQCWGCSCFDWFIKIILQVKKKWPNLFFCEIKWYIFKGMVGQKCKKSAINNVQAAWLLSQRLKINVFEKKFTLQQTSSGMCIGKNFKYLRQWLS